MMLDYLGEAEASTAVTDTIAQLLTNGSIRSLEVGAHGTDEIGSMIAEGL